MDNELDLALLFLRVFFGAALMAHGAQKLFGWFNGPGIAGFAGWLGSMGIRQPKLAATMAAVSEFFGGLLFAAGLLTPLAALLLVSVMFTAIATVHWKAGFFAADGGYEFNLAIIVAALAVVLAGPGEFSLDAALDIAADTSGLVWAAGVLLLAAIGSAGSLMGRAGSAPADGGAPDPTAA